MRFLRSVYFCISGKVTLTVLWLPTAVQVRASGVIAPTVVNTIIAVAAVTAIVPFVMANELPATTVFGFKRAISSFNNS